MERVRALQVEAGLKELMPGIDTKVNELGTAVRGIVPAIELNAKSVEKLADLTKGNLLVIKRWQ